MMKRNALWTALLGLALASAGCGATSAEYGDDDSGGNVSFGGAQDIGQFRSILDEGGIPGEETLDANGFFNEHFIELPEPDCGQPVCGHAMLSVGPDWIGGEYQAALQISMNSPIDPASLERLPLNMVVVVDTSGSMAADNRIGYVRQGLNILIDELQEGDRLAIIEYNSVVNVLATLDDADQARLHSVVDGLYAAGATNLYGGLEAGLQMLAEGYDHERQNRVVLLSDGMPTAGITGDSSIIAMANNYIADGIGLTTIGVGTDFNVNLMRGLAERGAGNFYFLEDVNSIDEVFRDELDYFVTPIALDLYVSVTTGPAYELGEVVGTRLWNNGCDGSCVYIPAAFIASRTSATPDPNGRRGGGSAIIIRMIPTGMGGAIDPSEVAHVHLSYQLPNAAGSVEQDIDVTNPNDPGNTPEEAWFSHQAMAKNYAVYNVFLGLREAARRAAWDYSCALSALEILRTKAQLWNLSYEDPDMAADLALVGQFAENLRNHGGYVAEGGDENVCDSSGYDDGYDGCYDPETGTNYCADEDYEYGMYACSLGGGAGGSARAGLALVLLAIGLAVRPRRRRRSVRRASGE